MMALRAAARATPKSFASANLLIGGVLRPAEHGATADVVDPASGAPFTTVPEASARDLDEAVRAAAAAFPAWAATDWGERRAALADAADRLEARGDEFAVALTKEQGKPLGAARGEVAACVAGFRHTSEADLLAPTVVHEDKARRYEIHYAPRGVVAAITPWNFPLLMAKNKLAEALLSGNSCVLKPSPYTPLTATMFGEIARESFPPGVVNVVTGGDALGAALVAHESVATVSFTGSVATGRAIASAAAPDLKRVVLELGGNDAAIVLSDADVEAVAPRIFGAAMYNSGQVCIAIKRVYAHDSVRGALVAKLGELAEAAVVGDGHTRVRNSQL